jgi:hypothetical protein
MPRFGGRGDPFSSDLFDPLGASWPWDAVRRGGDDATAVARTNVDWHENEKEHIFSAEIPGTFVLRIFLSWRRVCPSI